MDTARTGNAVEQQLQAHPAAESDVGHHVVVAGVQRLHSCAHEASVPPIQREPDDPAHPRRVDGRAAWR
ncbi:hypothetical protein [Mycobacterium kiyosense]